MELNGYTLAVRPGTESNGYVEMEHNTVYTVYLINENETRCDARLSVDGLVVGTWRINPEDSIKLERGVDDKGRFTFYKLGSKEGELSELVKNEHLGLIKCVFRPEKTTVYDPAPYTKEVFRDGNLLMGIEKSVTRGGRAGGQSAGGTGLSGYSTQNFDTASRITHYDDDKATTIYLRLACKDAPEVVQDIRPLRKKTTDIPSSLI